MGVSVYLIMLSVIILNAIMLGGVAPSWDRERKNEKGAKSQRVIHCTAEFQLQTLNIHG
jgi:hypothetical protein